MKTVMMKKVTMKADGKTQSSSVQAKALPSALWILLVKMFLMSVPGSYGSKVSGADLNFSKVLTYSTSGFFSQGLDGFSVRGGCSKGYDNVQGDGLLKAQSTKGWGS